MEASAGGDDCRSTRCRGPLHCLHFVQTRHPDRVRRGSAGGARHANRGATGDAEDVAGRPFAGPAGKLLDRSLAEAGFDRARTYITNVVKHFKWVPRGTRCIHSKPGSVEIEACFPWLEAEIAAVKPQIVVALGATAAQTLFGRAFRVTRDRGRLVPSPFAPYALATVHPSALLRAPDEQTRDREIRRFVEDLRKVAAIRT